MSETPRADFWFSIVLAALGLGIVVESWRMPRLEDLGVHPMSAPGLTPGVLGLVLALLGLALLVRSLRNAVGAEGAADDAADSGDHSDGGWGRFAITLTFCLIYAIVLLGWLPFWLATALFVFGFVLVFTWRGGSVLRSALIAGLLALGVAAAVTLLFEQVFLVRLP